MDRSRLNRPMWTKINKMDRSRAKWTEWTDVDQNGQNKPKWIKIDQNVVLMLGHM